MRNALELELTSFFNLPAIQASERAEKVQEAVAALIASRVSRCETAGTSALITLLGSNSDIVAGFCYVLPTDDEHVTALKQQRVQVAAILLAIRAMAFNDFEKFGSRILDELGASYSHVTPHQGDQGIDFYGKLSIGVLHQIPQPFLKLAHDVVVLFAGQAKHYPASSIGPDVVRELIGAVTLARTGTFSRPDLDIFADLRLKPFSPLVTLLLTTGEITKGAVHLAEASGVIARSGEQLAVFLADKGVGMVGTPANQFDQQTFEDWLNGTSGTANS